MTRGWSSKELPVVCDDETLWTVADAAHALGALPDSPPSAPTSATAARLRDLVRYQAMTTDAFTPVGKRRSTRAGQSGRYARVYRAIEFIELYEQMGNKKAPPVAA